MTAKLAYDLGFWLLLLTVFMACVTARKWQTKRMKLYYQPTNTLWADLVKGTELATMKYKPYLLTPNAHWHTFFHGTYQGFICYFYPTQYRREVLELSDGGQLGLDWVQHETEALRDLVVAIPGLSGDSGELYCRTIAKACLEQNLDCVFVNYRGLGGVPLTVSPFF